MLSFFLKFSREKKLLKFSKKKNAPGTRMDKQFRLAFPEQSNSPGLKTFAMGIWDTATESQSYQE